MLYERLAELFAKLSRTEPPNFNSDTLHQKMNTQTTNTTNNYGDSCGNGQPPQVVATLTESVATLTRELETSQQQKSNLIKIIDKLTNK
jgi:hypothetical protein